MGDGIIFALIVAGLLVAFLEFGVEKWGQR